MAMACPIGAVAGARGGRVAGGCPPSSSCSLLPAPSRRIALSFAGNRRSSHPRSTRGITANLAAASGQGEADLVILQYSDLCSRANLSEQIEAAYGPGGLGVLGVAGVPGVLEMRSRLLPLAERFAQSPEDVLKAAEDPASAYSFGWSHGVETLEDGQPDSRKGSYYANPQFDQPTDDPDLIARYPSYCRPNVWPHDHLPELRGSFMELGGAIVHVGTLLAEHCDRYVATHAPEGGAEECTSLAEVLSASPCAKGRLLYYFPPGGEEESGGREGNWCGWHKDHGSLTGLTAAMYTRGGEPVACPDPRAGLHVKNRHGEVVRVVIPPDHLAFQIGEASQVHTGGLLRATPHFVRGAEGAAAAGVSRSTLAVFMQPRWDVSMASPGWARADDVGVGQWRAGDDFGEFTNRTLAQTSGGVAG